MTDTHAIKDKAALAALELAARYGWHYVSLAEIAKQANIGMAALRDHFDDRFDILAAIERMIDRKVLENIGIMAADNAIPPRDRLFDILMERFDALNNHRDGLCAILDSMKTDPKQAIFGLPHLGRSMSWMLEATGIETTGLKGALKIAGLSGIYLKTLRVWREDTSPDMAKTMAALDQNLGRAEHWADRLGL